MFYNTFIIRKAQDDAKAMKLLLDTYKSAQKDSRDKVQVSENKQLYMFTVTMVMMSKKLSF